MEFETVPADNDAYIDQHQILPELRDLVHEDNLVDNTSVKSL